MLFRKAIYQQKKKIKITCISIKTSFLFRFFTYTLINCIGVSRCSLLICTLTCQFFPIYHRQAPKSWLLMVTQCSFKLMCHDFLSCCPTVIHLGCFSVRSNFRSFWMCVHMAFFFFPFLLFLPLQVNSQEWGFWVLA